MAFVYKIICVSNNKLYIGSTKRLLCQRWGDHKSCLRTQTHPNIHLQRAWNKYGADSFIFQKIEECEELVLQEREQYWMDYFNVYKTGFNRNPIAGNSTSIKRSEETCKKISLSGNWKKANEKWKGSKHTEETRSIIKEKRAKQVLPEWTDERRKKLSLSKQANKHTVKHNFERKGNYLKITAFNDIETLNFNNTHEALLYFNLKDVNGITRVLRNERTYYKGYKWIAQLKSDKLLENQEIDNQQPITNLND